MKMTRVTCCLFLLVLSLVALSFTTSAPRAAHAASGNVSKFKFRGLSAQANFDSVSPDGCIETFVFVEAAHAVGLFIGQFDNCTGALLLNASGSTTNTMVQIDKHLLSASFSASIPVFDSVSGTTFPVSVTMTWTSTSTIMDENQTFHFHTTGFTENSLFNARFRNAVASGTVSAGTTNFTPSASVFAQIMSALQVDVAITSP